MGITVGHDSGGAAAMEIALLTGDAKAQQQAEAIARQQQEADRQYGLQMDRMAMAEEQAGLGREQQVRMAGIQQGNRMDMMEAESEEYDHRLSAQQKSDRAKLEDALHQVEMSDDFTPEEKSEARRRIIAKLSGIKAIPRKKENQFPKNRDIGEDWSSGGYSMTRGPDGNPIKLGVDPKAPPTFKDFVNLQKEARVQLTIEDDDGNKIFPPQEKIDGLVNSWIKARMGIAGVQEETQQESPPPGAGFEEDVPAVPVNLSSKTIPMPKIKMQSYEKFTPDSISISVEKLRQYADGSPANLEKAKIKLIEMVGELEKRRKRSEAKPGSKGNMRKLKDASESIKIIIDQFHELLRK